MRPLAPILLISACLGAPALAGDGPSLGVSREDEAREAVEASVEALRGLPIGGVKLAGDLIRSNREAYRKLVRLTGLQKGTPLDPRAVGRAWSHLLKTGYFRAVTVQPTEAGGKAFLDFDLEGQVTITRIDVAYVDDESRWYPKLFADAIRKRLLLRRGGNFPVDQPEFIERQVANVKELYLREGYVGTEVAIIPAFHGRHDKQVRLLVLVKEGSRPWLGQVLLRGNKAFGYSKLVRPIETGERIDFWRPIFGLLDMGKYRRRALREQLEQVERRYRDEGWLSARVRLVDAPEVDGTVFPLVEVHEGPRVALRFEGNRVLGDAELEAVTTFRETAAFDETEIAASGQAMRAAYEAKARYYARIDARVEAVDADHLTITFSIDEGPQIYVEQIEIEGNRLIDRETLLGAMQTKGIAADGVVSFRQASSGVLQESRMVNDLAAIRELYRDRGFPNVRFRCKPEQESLEDWNLRRMMMRSGDTEATRAITFARFDTWSAEPAGRRCFFVERNPNDRRLVRITITLDEGARTTIDRMAIDPLLQKMDPATQDEAHGLLQKLGLVDERNRWIAGAGFNTQKLQSVQGMLLRWYLQRGYLQVRVEPGCGERPCTQQGLYGAHLEDVFFTIDRGPRSVLQGIFLKGNLHTQDFVILDEFLLEDGQPIPRDELFRSQRNLRGLGLFEGVRVETIGNESEGAQGEAGAGEGEGEASTPVAVVVTVTEKDYQFFDAAVGLRLENVPLTGDGLPLLYVLAAGLRDRNLFGRGLEVGLRGEHTNLVGAPFDAAADDASWRVGPFYRDRRLGGTKVDLNLLYTYSRDRTLQRDQYAEEHSLEAVVTYDFSFLSYPAAWGNGLRFTFGGELSRERLRGLTRLNERPPFGDWNNFVSFRPSLQWDRRDNPIHPSRGWFLRQDTEAVLQDDAFTATALSASFKEELVAQYVQSFFDRQLIIVPTFRLGAIQTEEAEGDLPADFLFKAGGDGVLLPVRGYADAAIEASGGEAIDPITEAFVTEGGQVMLLGSLELRFPTRLAEDLWGAVFGDIGAVTSTFSELEGDRLYPSVGAGLRYLIQAQIPLRLDVGFPMRATRFNDRLDPRLKFNVLYTL